VHLSDEHEPIVLLGDGETFTGLGGCELAMLTHEEAERVATDNCLSWVKEVEALGRTFDLEKIVRWPFANGYQPPKTAAKYATRLVATVVALARPAGDMLKGRVTIVAYGSAPRCPRKRQEFP
jgi:hypothetical protein